MEEGCGDVLPWVGGVVDGCETEHQLVYFMFHPKWTRVRPQPQIVYSDNYPITLLQSICFCCCLLLLMFLWPTCIRNVFWDNEDHLDLYKGQCMEITCIPTNTDSSPATVLPLRIIWRILCCGWRGYQTWLCITNTTSATKGDTLYRVCSCDCPPQIFPSNSNAAYLRW